MDPGSDPSLIVFFDLETTMPPNCIIVEFGAILVCPRKLVKKDCYSTFVRPHDLSIITPHLATKGITRDAVANAPFFVEIAQTIFNLLNGRTWAGHNIEEFDWTRIKEAFREISRPPPVPRGIIDTYPLLETAFGRRAGNMKLETLATYFELDKPPHRSLGDACTALEVFKNCGAVLFLESTFPDILKSDVQLVPDDVSLGSINAYLTPFYHGNPKIQILHNDVKLKLWCVHMNVRFEPKRCFSPLTFVVDASESLYEVLQCCNDEAFRLFEHSGGDSEWKNVITYYAGRPNVRLRMDRETEICSKGRNGDEEPIRVRDDQELICYFRAGTCIDALFLVDTYDFETAGIKLVAEKLVVYKERSYY